MRLRLDKQLRAKTDKEDFLESFVNGRMRKQAKRVASFRPSSLGWASTRGRCYAQSLHFKRNALQALTHIESTLGIEKVRQ